MPTTSPGRYAGYDNGWVVSLVYIPLAEFDKSIVDFPNIKRFPGGASNDMSPESARPGQPCAFDGSCQSAEDPSGWRLSAVGSIRSRTRAGRFARGGSRIRARNGYKNRTKKP